MTRTDIDLATDLDINVDDVGDLQTADDPIEQRAVLVALNVAIPLRGSRLTRETAADARDLLTAELRQDTVIDSPVDGRIVRTSRNSVRFAFDVGNRERPVTIDLGVN
jgi:hypothetical protein